MAFFPPQVVLAASPVLCLSCALLIVGLRVHAFRPRGGCLAEGVGVHLTSEGLTGKDSGLRLDFPRPQVLWSSLVLAVLLQEMGSDVSPKKAGSKENLMAGVDGERASLAASAEAPPPPAASSAPAAAPATAASTAAPTAAAAGAKAPQAAQPSGPPSTGPPSTGRGRGNATASVVANSVFGGASGSGGTGGAGGAPPSNRSVRSTNPFDDDDAAWDSAPPSSNGAGRTVRPVRRLEPQAAKSCPKSTVFCALAILYKI